MSDIPLLTNRSRIALLGPVSTEKLATRAAALKLGLEELRDTCAKSLTSEHPSCDTLTIIIEGMALVEKSLGDDEPNGAGIHEVNPRRAGGSFLN